ncbi:MAG: hypothetical protein ACREOO_18215 [bacterium]
MRWSFLIRWKFFKTSWFRILLFASEFDLHFLSRQKSTGKFFPAFLFNLPKKRVIMIRIVMSNRQLFDAGALRDFDGLFPTAMAPAFFLLELFRRAFAV